MTTQIEKQLLARGFNRRQVLRAWALLSGGAALPFYNEAALAQMSYVGGVPEGSVMINANENPLGPCPDAIAAMQEMLKQGGRYNFGQVVRLRETFASQLNLKQDSVDVFAGSSDPLHRAVIAFCGPDRPFVTGDPGYEAGERAARLIGAPVVRVPLTSAYAHDVRGMVEKAGGKPGVFYVCNPNNPTGTVTPRADIEWLADHLAPGSLLLLDEAYIHFSDEHSGIDLVAAGKDVMVLRTFSKIYGMAGLRAGAAIAKPEMLERIRLYATGFLPSTGMSGATASLLNRELVPERKKINRDTREKLFSWLRDKKIGFVPSVSNKFMMDARRPGREMAAAFAAKRVYIGRSWPSWPNHVRVTIGTPAEMDRFRGALDEVLSGT